MCVILALQHGWDCLKVSWLYFSHKLHVEIRNCLSEKWGEGTEIQTCYRIYIYIPDPSPHYLTPLFKYIGVLTLYAAYSLKVFMFAHEFVNNNLPDVFRISIKHIVYHIVKKLVKEMNSEYPF